MNQSLITQSQDEKCNGKLVFLIKEKSLGKLGRRPPSFRLVAGQKTPVLPNQSTRSDHIPTYFSPSDAGLLSAPNNSLPTSFHFLLRHSSTNHAQAHTSHTVQPGQVGRASYPKPPTICARLVPLTNASLLAGRSQPLERGCGRRVVGGAQKKDFLSVALDSGVHNVTAVNRRPSSFSKETQYPPAPDSCNLSIRSAPLIDRKFIPLAHCLGRL